MAQQSRTPIVNRKVPARAAALISFGCLLAVLTCVATAQAQTFSVLYTLNGTTSGNYPTNGLISDRQGNLYGTAYGGGIVGCNGVGCGLVFKLSRHGSGWIYTILYRFAGLTDGANPDAPLAIGPDGSLYGTTFLGGNQSCPFGGCGTVFKLSPPPNICPTISCEWRKTTLYEFTGGADGQYPLGQLTFDRAGSGSLYGTASAANVLGQTDGSVFELTHSGGDWTFNLLYAFPGGTSGAPLGGVTFDNQGNLWGVQTWGGAENCGDPAIGDACGSIYKLSPSPSGWTETNVFAFNASIGGGATGTLVSDPSGNFYGTLCCNGPAGSGGVFKFVPSTGEFNLIYANPGNPDNSSGPYGGVVMDPAGNLYAADNADGPFHCSPYGCGFIFELSPANGYWYFTNLHNFTGGSDGGVPAGPLALDAEGNVYGGNLDNVIFQITP